MENLNLEAKSIKKEGSLCLKLVNLADASTWGGEGRQYLTAKPISWAPCLRLHDTNLFIKFVVIKYDGNSPVFVLHFIKVAVISIIIIAIILSISIHQSFNDQRIWVRAVTFCLTAWNLEYHQSITINSKKLMLMSQNKWALYTYAHHML